MFSFLIMALPYEENSVEDQGLLFYIPLIRAQTYSLNMEEDKKFTVSNEADPEL